MARFDKQTILDMTETFVRGVCQKREDGHGFEHVDRVRKMALRLGKGVGADPFVAEMIALLHDVEDHKFEKEADAESFLGSFDLDKKTFVTILAALPMISFSECPIPPEDFPIEGKVVQDADRLDAIGAIGVARAFSYGGSKHRPMYGAEGSTLEHFDEKLLLLDRYLNLEESKAIATHRMEFLRTFYDEFVAETKALK